MNTVLAGFTALGVLLVPLLQARVDLESILFGDILASGTPDLIRTAISAIALVLLLIGHYYEGFILSEWADGVAGWVACLGLRVGFFEELDFARAEALPD